jgi:hypothetical protein
MRSSNHARRIPGHVIVFTGCMLVILMALAAFVAGRESTGGVNPYRGNPSGYYVAHRPAQGRAKHTCSYRGTPRTLCVDRAPREACLAEWPHLPKNDPCYWVTTDDDQFLFTTHRLRIARS